jgi:cytochrome P450
MFARLRNLSVARWLSRFLKQLVGVNPFQGDIRPARVPLLWGFWRRPALPFPHPWNYDQPIRILETYFWGADAEECPGRHNRYLDVPGFAPVLVSRDPRVIRVITAETGDREGQFDRDTLPSVGIARATGPDTLLFANGPTWRTQKKLAAPPFGKTTLFQPEQFQEFESTFRHTVSQRLDALERLMTHVRPPVRIQLEPEIKAVMLEMLVNNFFGLALSYDQIRNHYVPALERVIDHIVRDTVLNRVGIPISRWPNFHKGIRQTKEAYAAFEHLTDLVLGARQEQKALWKQFKSDAPDEALRSNIKVFLAGALEATTSYASWAIAHLARNPAAQEKVFQEIKDVELYSPENLAGAKYFNHVLEETLRLTPSLYFLPRRATRDTWIQTSDGQRLMIPNGTHILLDVWHANRHEDHWGVTPTGYPANEFIPERWESAAMQARGTKEVLHFGFGHGARVCPGKHLGQLEIALVVGAFVKLFRFRAVNEACHARASVSTTPLDGVLIDLELRDTRQKPAPSLLP